MNIMRPLDSTKEENIIKAVFTIVGKNGLTGITMSAISKEAALSVGTLYTYFESKDEVIEAAYSSVEHMLTQKMYAGFDLDQPIKESLKRIYMNSINYRLKHYDETVFIDQYIQSIYVQNHLTKQVKEFEQQHKPLYELIKKGQDDGVFSIMPPFTMISFINGSIRSCSNGIVQKLIPLSKQTFEDCFNMAWKGIQV